jgi:hypothetical protein
LQGYANGRNDCIEGRLNPDGVMIVAVASMRTAERVSAPLKAEKHSTSHRAALGV